jgi:hypothetical protein
VLTIQNVFLTSYMFHSIEKFINIFWNTGLTLKRNKLYNVEMAKKLANKRFQEHLQQIYFALQLKISYNCQIILYLWVI